jgi:hypothetical protein
MFTLVTVLEDAKVLFKLQVMLHETNKFTPSQRQSQPGSNQQHYSSPSPPAPSPRITRKLLFSLNFLPNLSNITGQTQNAIAIAANTLPAILLSNLWNITAAQSENAADISERVSDRAVNADAAYAVYESTRTASISLAANPTGTRPIIDTIQGIEAAGGVVQANHHNPTARTGTATAKESNFISGVIGLPCAVNLDIFL